jgi:putative tricarboxylic transport membrane protein
MLNFDLISVAVGLLTGVIGGMLPGIGHLLCLILIMPWMVSWNPLEMFVCFAIMVQVSQFLGSLTTTFTRVPGELSSMPMLEELKFVPQHRMPEVLSSTAIGSMIGMILAMILCWLLLDFMAYISYLFRTEVMLILMSSAVAMIFYLSRGSRTTKLLLLALGAVLGLIGYNQNLEVNILTFGNTALMAGVPTAVVLVCLFAIPQLYQIKNLSLAWNPTHMTFSIPWSSVKVMPVSAVIGFFAGMMPGLATIFSSQLAYNWIKSRNQDPVIRITATETANNAGAIGQMIPMLVLGLPILSSEALVLALMESKGFQANLITGSKYMWQTLAPLAITALIAAALAWPLALLTIQILRVNMNVLRNVAVLILLSVIFYQAYQDMQLMFTIGCFLVLSGVGWLIRKQDTMLLIFVFFISERLLDHAVRFSTLYF